MNSSFRQPLLPPLPLAGETDEQNSSGGGEPSNGTLPNAPAQAGEGEKQRKREKRDVDGWLIFDKPIGMTSTHAVAVVKRAFAAKKAGHAGTLDPLASGVLPIALGEATKTVPFVMDGRKTYRFTIRWGIETDTDDAEGKILWTSEVRPDEAAIAAALPAFTGDLMQTPPKFSAIKIAGERAYDLAREGAEVVLEPRPVHVGRLSIVARPDADHVELEAECGKGTYVRALARDLGRVLGTFGHVVALRRTAVGPFAQDTAVSVEQLPQPESGLAGERGPLLPIQAGLSELPAFQITRSDAARLARGQSVIMRGRDAPIVSGCAAASSEGTLIAIVDAEGGELHPRRIFNHRMRH